jgi:lipopolysaccharide transport system permease protein
MTPLTLIRPDNRLSDSWLASLRHLARELFTFRAHIATVYSFDLRQTYRGSAIHRFWRIAMPLLPVAVYSALAALRVVPTVEGIPSTIYVASGVTLWFLFVGCVQQPIAVVKNRNSEAMKTALPLSVTIAASFAQLLFDTAIRLGLLAVIMILTRTAPAITFPLGLALIAVAAAAFLGLGLLLAILNIIYPDVQRAVGVILQYGIFLSGVIFPLSAFGPFRLLDDINPFAVFIGAARHLVFGGAPVHATALMLTTFLSLGIFLLGCRMFYLMEYRIRGIG